MAKKNPVEELADIGRWMRKKFREKLQGLPYTFDRDDFDLITGIVTFSNWFIPRFGNLKLYKKFAEQVFFGRPEDNITRSKILPLNAPIKKQAQAIIPYQLLDGVMEKAGCRVIMNECWCRKAMACNDYPIDFGCINIGEGARILAEKGVAREVTAEEAKAHIRRAGELGLVAFPSHVENEEKGMGVPKHLLKNFLEFCFCCPCCCLGLRNLKYFSPYVRKNIITSIGFVAKALPTCKGCLDCVDICPMDAIRAKGDMVWVNEDDCIGCGLCQNVCPHNAIRLVQIEPGKKTLLDYFEGMGVDIS